MAAVLRPPTVGERVPVSGLQQRVKTVSRTARVRIGVDARSLFAPRPRGTGRTLRDVYALLPALRPDWQFVLYHQRRVPAPPESLRSVLAHPNVTARRLEMPGDRWGLWFQLRLPLAAWRERLDLLHLPANAAPVWSPVPLVVTVHDLIPLTVSEEASAARRRAFRRDIARAVRQAVRIVTPSVATRDELMRSFRVLPQRVRVVPWAADQQIAATIVAGRADPAAAAARYGLSRPWLLNFSGASPRKNAAGLLEAFARLVSSLADAPQLVLVGVEPAERRTALAERAARLGIASRCRFLGFVPHEDLPGLLVGAAGLVMPSLGEGFGLPILDAFAAGTPVLTSRAGSLPEVAGPAALYCDTQDVASIAAGLRRLLDPEVSGRLRAAGRERLRRFSWERTAAALADVYADCLESARRQPGLLRSCLPAGEVAE